MDIFTNINWVDVLILLIMLKATYTGLRIGFVAGIFNFLGALFCVVLGMHLYSGIADALIVYVSLPKWLARCIGLALNVVPKRTSFKYGIVLIFRILNIQFFTHIEKVGGAILGAFRGILLCGLVCFTILFLPVDYFQNSVTKDSKLAYFFTSTIPTPPSSSTNSLFGSCILFKVAMALSKPSFEDLERALL